MSRALKRRLLFSGAVVVAILVVVVFLLNQIDKATPLTPTQMMLRPGAVEIASATAVDHAPYLEYLRQHAQPPVDYVVEKFRTHDAVQLGEAHQVREDCELIENLIEPIYRRAGVRLLAMELIKQKRTEELRELLTAPSYDAARVTRIFQEDYFYWGFQEYEDILHAVWAFNRTLAPGEAPFAVVGIQPDIDAYTAHCGSLPKKLMHLPSLLSMEEGYAAPVMQALERNQKILVQVGIHHAFRRYHVPKVVDGKMYGEFARIRMGELLVDKYGDRVFQISLHMRHIWTDRYTDEPTNPVSVLLEDVYVENGGMPVGFDLQDSPFAALRDTSSSYFAFQPYVTLGDLAQGYILQKPYRDLHTVAWVHGFANASNLEHLRTYALQRQLISKGEGRTPVELNERLSAALADGQRFP